MNQQPDGQFTIPVTQETAEWLQEFGGYGSFNDIILMLLRFHDAYRVDHKSHTDLSRILQSTLSAAADESCIKIMEKIVGLKPGAISFTIRERLTGMMLPHEKKIILTFYIHHIPFCLAYLYREETGMVALYIPDTGSRYTSDHEPGSSDEHTYFSGWKWVATITSDDTADLDATIQPIHEVFNKVYRTSGKPMQRTARNEMNEPLSETKEKQLRFWNELVEKANEKKDFDLFSNCKAKSDSRLIAGGGETGTVFTYTLQKNSVIVSFRISKDKEKGKWEKSDLFSKLEESKEEIEVVFGGPLDWITASREKKEMRFDYIRIKLHNGGLLNEDRWPEIQDEMIETMERLKKAITPVMKRIKGEMQQ